MTEMNTATATALENNNEAKTTKYDLVEQLSHKMHITLEEARNALEASDWNMLTATHLLEQEEFLRKQALNEAAESCGVGEEDAQDSAAAVNTANAEESASARKAARPRKQRRWFSNLCDHLRRLLAYGNRNHFVISKDGEQLLEMPMTVMALLLVCSLGTCALLMAVGLFAGCRYSITAAAKA